MIKAEPTIARAHPGVRLRVRAGDTEDYVRVPIDPNCRGEIGLLAEIALRAGELGLAANFTRDSQPSHHPTLGETSEQIEKNEVLIGSCVEVATSEQASELGLSPSAVRFATRLKNRAIEAAQELSAIGPEAPVA